MTDIQTVGVIGAGQMGAGIAQVAAQAGYEVILSDVDLPRAQKGRDGIIRLLAKGVEKGKIAESDADEAIARITPVGEIAPLAGTMRFEMLSEPRPLPRATRSFDKSRRHTRRLQTKAPRKAGPGRGRRS